MYSYDEYAKIRDSKGLKDSEVSRLAQIPQSTFSDWKKGKSYPKADKLLRISQALDVDPSVLMTAVFGTYLVYNDGKTEKELIAELYMNADDYTKEMVKRILKYTEGI